MTTSEASDYKENWSAPSLMAIPVSVGWQRLQARIAAFLWVHRPISWTDMQKCIRTYTHRMQTLYSVSFTHEHMTQIHCFTSSTQYQPSLPPHHPTTLPTSHSPDHSESCMQLFIRTYIAVPRVWVKSVSSVYEDRNLVILGGELCVFVRLISRGA